MTSSGRTTDSIIDMYIYLHCDDAIRISKFSPYAFLSENIKWNIS